MTYRIEAATREEWASRAFMAEQERDKLREVNAAQAEQIAARDLTIATQARALESLRERVEAAEGKLRAYQQDARERLARSGE